MTWVQAAKHGVRKGLLVPAGRRLGAPRVHLSSPLIGGGNYLYYWMWAFHRDSDRAPARVQQHENVDAWLDEFPLARHLSIRLEEASRLLSDFDGGHCHTYGRDFTRQDVDDFCRALVESSPRFRERLRAASSYLQRETVVLNVRRGDYYVYPHLTRMYGLDIERFVRHAVGHLSDSGSRVRDVLVVSDDIAWCEEHIKPILGGSFRTVPDRRSMFDDLATLASARTLLLGNSTFSFWGAYLASSLGDKPRILAPDRHFINENGTKMRDPYDPDWIVVDDG